MAWLRLVDACIWDTDPFIILFSSVFFKRRGQFVLDWRSTDEQIFSSCLFREVLSFQLFLSL